ncbi:MAG: hypothetical protein WCV84_04275 [Patescibacteria group bacterium]
MPELKELHQRIRDKKKAKKDVHAVYKDTLATSTHYQELMEQLKVLNAKKKQVENALRTDCAKELEEAARLAMDIKTDAQLMSDVALTMMMKGEKIELMDDNDVKYEPIIKVSFKRIP